MEARGERYQEIASVAAGGGVYLRRWRLWRGRFFSVYAHRVLRSDEGRCPHDHPWGFWSLVLWGWYVEEVFDAGADPELGGVLVRRGMLSLAYRPPYHVHRIVEVSPGGAATFLLLGPRVRRWGFIGRGGRWVAHDEKDPRGECPGGMGAA